MSSCIEPCRTTLICTRTRTRTTTTPSLSGPSLTAAHQRWLSVQKSFSSFNTIFTSRPSQCSQLNHWNQTAPVPTVSLWAPTGRPPPSPLSTRPADTGRGGTLRMSTRTTTRPVTTMEMLFKPWSTKNLWRRNTWRETGVPHWSVTGLFSPPTRTGPCNVWRVTCNVWRVTRRAVSVWCHIILSASQRRCSYFMSQTSIVSLLLIKILHA